MQRIWGKTVNTALLLAAMASTGMAVADTVELSNGDTLNGKVVEANERGVVLRHDVLGTIAIGQDRIKKVTTTPDTGIDSDLVPQAQPQLDEPAAPDADAAKAKAEQAKKVKQQAEAAAAQAPKSAFAQVLEDWKNKLTLGLNGAGGNTDRQNYYVKLDSKFEDGRHRWLANAQWFYGMSEGEVTQNQVNTNLTKDWLQKDSDWFFFVKGQYKYDANRNWENRTSAFGGGGYTLTKTEDVEVNTRVGFGGTYEYGNLNEFTPEALFGSSILKWEINDRAAISGETVYYPSLEDSSNFRVESSLEWVYKLDVAKGLSLKLGVQNEYDSKTPNDTGNNDLNYFGALVVSF